MRTCGSSPLTLHTSSARAWVDSIVPRSSSGVAFRMSVLCCRKRNHLCAVGIEQPVGGGNPQFRVERDHHVSRPARPGLAVVGDLGALVADLVVPGLAGSGAGY